MGCLLYRENIQYITTKIIIQKQIPGTTHIELTPTTPRLLQPVSSLITELDIISSVIHHPIKIKQTHQYENKAKDTFGMGLIKSLGSKPS